MHEVDVFDPEELDLVAGQRRTPISPSAPGEIAAAAFEMFDGGTELRQVVVQLRQTPASIAELHDQWLDFGGDRLVIGTAARAELVRLVGPFDDIAGLVDRISELFACRIEVSVEDDTPLARASDAEVEHAIVGMLDQAGSAAGPA